MKFRTHEQITKEVADWNNKEIDKVIEYRKKNSEFPYIPISLRTFEKVGNARAIWNELYKLNVYELCDLISLLEQEEPIFNCVAGHYKRMYDFASILRYSMSEKQRDVCYKILEQRAAEILV